MRVPRGAGFAHVSCLARAAQVAVERDVQNGWLRWCMCGLCEQKYHGVVKCALAWACWKTYVGRPEDGWGIAMMMLGAGLFHAEKYEDALSVIEAELSMKRRLGRGADEDEILTAQSNLANTYDALGRHGEASQMYREVYSRRVRLKGEEHQGTLRAAFHYATSLFELKRFEEAKSLLRESIPVARRRVGEGHELTLRLRSNYAGALCRDPNATLDDLREAVTTFEDVERIARRVVGGAHPLTKLFESHLRRARAALRAREDAEPDVSAQELDAAEAAAAAAAGDGSG